MKKTAVLIVVSLGFSICAIGCGEKKPKEPESSGIVEFITGAQQLKTFQKAKVEIATVNTEMEERIKDADAE